MSANLEEGNARMVGQLGCYQREAARNLQDLFNTLFDGIRLAECTLGHPLGRGIGRPKAGDFTLPRFRILSVALSSLRDRKSVV